MENAFIEVFKQKCDEVYSGGFIMCEQKIHNLLIFVAKNEIIYSIVQKCTDGYDYYAAKYKCLVNNFGEKIVKIPTDRREAIAFCYSLMFEIYSGKTLISELLDNYFEGNGYKERFSSFWVFIVKRFSQDVVSVIDDMQQLVKKEENEQSVDLKRNLTFLDSVKNQLYCQKIKTEDRRFAIYFINKIIESLSLNTGNYEIPYYGLKAILKHYKKLAVYCEKIGEMLGIKDEL